MTLLLLAYTIAGYAYFLAVLAEDDGCGATPAELAGSALLGLLLGPPLWALAVAVRAMAEIRRIR